MKQRLLLLEDIEALGKKGEVVTAKPGYIRNFLLPKGCAVVATSNMLRKQERLRKERAEQAVVDRRESDELAQKIEGITIETSVKVDPEGHMYGSVAAMDIARLFQEKGFPIEKKHIALTRPIKETGLHAIVLKLKEGVTAKCNLQIIPEGGSTAGLENVVKEIPEEEKKEETPPAAP